MSQSFYFCFFVFFACVCVCVFFVLFLQKKYLHWYIRRDGSRLVTISIKEHGTRKKRTGWSKPKYTKNSKRQREKSSRTAVEAFWCAEFLWKMIINIPMSCWCHETDKSTAARWISFLIIYKQQFLHSDWMRTCQSIPHQWTVQFHKCKKVKLSAKRWNWVQDSVIKNDWQLLQNWAWTNKMADKN